MNMFSKASLFVSGLSLAFAEPLHNKQNDLKLPIGPLLARQVDLNTADYYLGYRASDFDTPWAKYYNDTPPEISPQFATALAVREPQTVVQYTPIANSSVISIPKLVWCRDQ